MPPWSTYRVQLHAQFGFSDAAAIADYLAELGVTHLYCSPYLQAAAGSTHGYDVVDPTHLNSELGGAPGHATLVAALRAVGMSQVLDIVPNHMAADQANAWWWDVLENGPASPYARFFDIDWEATDRKTAFKVLVPVLGDDYGRVVDAGEIGLARRGGTLVASYYDHDVPVSPRTLDDLLAAAARRSGSPELAALADGFAALPTARVTDPAAVTERHDSKLALAAELDRLCRVDPGAAAALDAEIAALAADPDRLDLLLRRQNYRLAHWRTASEELDYRRFFNIDSLVGLRMEDPAVFDATHRLVLELVRDGTVSGLRIDHVDGLRDPQSYLDELSRRSGGVYTVVEKILDVREGLDTDWPVAGTSGYDFLIRVNNLFVATDHEAAMTRCYTDFTGETAPYAEVVHTAKLQIMRQELAAEVHRVTGLVADLTDGDPRYRRHRDHTRRVLRDAVRELAAHFPVYRTYVTPVRRDDPRDRGPVTAAVAAAGACRPDLDPELLQVLGDLALGQPPGGRHPGPAEMEFAERFQQLTAPVTAKGVEDTAFYRYNRLTSLNEVGGDPGVFGRSPADFHRDTAEVAARWPGAMLTLSTHDTKRSADVRARLHVLSEIPGEWGDAVARWAGINDRHHRAGWPDRNTEYLYYQALVGAWPLDVDRAVAYMTKATKEAKVHTSWVDPSADYDGALEGFVRASLDDQRFIADLEGFLARTALVARGRRTSLAQTALLLTCPGIPDLYQGTEIWDLSLVDPDNRRPVDYEQRRALLKELAGGAVGGLDRVDEGGPKLALIQRVLRYRAGHPGIDGSGAYEALAFGGARPDDAVGFDRGGLAVVVPRLGPPDWAGTWVDLPPGRWTDVVTGADVGGGRRDLAELWAGFPVAVLARAGLAGKSLAGKSLAGSSLAGDRA